ncbi:MAG: hypothetical protein JWO67_25 [Streptosporangiaceae bacterium]|nr:hypothetical protein [Streptosporangiaceae bacterium]
MSATHVEPIAAASIQGETRPPDPDSAPSTGRRRGVRKPRAPRATTPRPETKDRKPRAPRAPRAVPLGPRIEQLHLVIGSALALGTQVPLPVIGSVPPAVGGFGAQIAEDAKSFGAAWEDYAKANPRVREALEKLLTVSELGTLLALYGKAAYAGAAATGRVPAMPSDVDAAEH